MTATNSILTHSPELDALFGGGFPLYSLNIIAGEPGAGKTILAQQIAFEHVRKNPESRVAYFSTLSEPTLNMVRHMRRFDFFDADAFGKRVAYRDVGEPLRKGDLTACLESIMRLVEEIEADMLVIDSFKAISEMAATPAEFRRFCFDVSMRLSTMRCTSFLVGEYARDQVSEAAEFAVADGILYLSMGMMAGEMQRLLQVLKMRGQAANMRAIPFAIGQTGIRLLGGLTGISPGKAKPRRKSVDIPSQVPGLDEILRGSLPLGQAVLVSGVSGTGKTTLCLQILARLAENGHVGVYFTFEETVGSLIRLGDAFGFDLNRQIDRGRLHLIHIPIGQIRIEENLEFMAEKVMELEPAGFVVDSSSVFLHRVEDQAMQREKIYQLSRLAHGSGALGLLISDIPAGSEGRLSRFGVEETMVDGVLALTSELRDGRRKRFAEAYKLRRRAIVEGRRYMEIAGDGIRIFHPDLTVPEPEERPVRLLYEPARRLISGDLDYGSSWLCRGEPGVGKSAMAIQFAKEGLDADESALIVSLDAPASQVADRLHGMEASMGERMALGKLAILDAFSPEGVNFRNWEGFLFAIVRAMRKMPKPLRLIMDSLSPIEAVYGNEFSGMAYGKNQLLRQPGVAVFDTGIRPSLEFRGDNVLPNFYDVVMDLFTPDWGEMRSAGNVGQRALQITKARGVHPDTQPYPFIITRDAGIVIQTEFYQREAVIGSMSR